MDTARYATLFQAEAREHLAELDAALLALEDSVRAGGDSVVAAVQVATIFRAIHTIKGMAGAMGYADIERVAHALESRCESVRRGDEPLHADLLALLFDGTDVLRGAIDDAARGVQPPQATVDTLLARLRPLAPAAGGAAARAAVEAAASGAGPPLPVASGAIESPPAYGAAERLPDVRVIDVRLVDDCPLKGVRAMIVLARLAALGEVQGTTPDQRRWQDETFDGVFGVTIASAVADEALMQAVRSAGEVATVAVREPITPPPSPGVSVAATAPGAPSAVEAQAVRTVRIDARRLDTLLELVGELVITRDRLLRTIEALEHPDRDVQRSARDAARLVSAIQDEVLQARLLPAGQVLDRFPRLVRDVSRELGKDVVFVMEGRDIELDRSLLDAIGDPILHLLRNALDHGIEDAVTREAQGKPARGELVLRVARERASVVIEVQDDGRGIDREAVRRRARDQGLIPPDTTSLDDDMLLRVLAHPGFSTARHVTSLSGRGVGLDVVNTRVRALGGQLELTSIEGAGAVVTLRLPATLAITRALLVGVAGQTFALPAGHVEEALEFHETAEGSLRERSEVTIRESVVPLVVLAEVFGLAQSTPAGAIVDGEGTGRYLAVVEAGGRRLALQVDALVAQQDIVVKPLDVVRGAAPWFSGATVLGDGRPALIIDVPSLVFFEGGAQDISSRA